MTACAQCGPGYRLGGEGCRHGRPGTEGDILTSGSVRADVVRELPHHVYQLWGRRGCLYVGSTSNLGQSVL